MRLLDVKTLCLILFLAALSACGTSQPTKYYLLSAGAPDTARLSTQRELTIGVGPIILPPYLDRREMVSRSSSNELNVAIYHQWAEPLRENFSRVIGEDLGRRLATDRIVRLPLKRSLRKVLVIDYQVAIAVRSFEKAPDGSVVLNARWTILDNDKQELVLRRSEYTQMPASADYAAQAAAQSQVLGRLSEEIAAAVLELQRDGSR
ncbi:MAG: membrane integrity-associated transporter subunit PqiC [Gammaproteobacteria bacterium]|nr:MAG: membrane integrity-associated transporter subunit PqiC [Gammaproteobacteria bacterium]